MTDDRSLTFSTAFDAVLPRLVALVRDQLVGVLLASGLWLVLLFATVVVMVLSPWVIGAPGLVVLASIYGDAEPPQAAILAVVVPSMLVYLAVFTAAFAAVFPGIQGSLYRAFDAAEAGDGAIGFTSPVATFTTNLRQVALTTLLQACLVFVGVLFFVLPGILVALATLFALPAAALDGLGARDAVRRAFEHTRANLGFHGGVLLGLVLIGALGSMIPFFGSGLAAVLDVAWLCLCYRAAFPRA